jgi:diguanylate cyclase
MPERWQKRRSQRLQMLALVGASYLLDTLLMLAFYGAGALELRVPLGYAGVATIVCGIFYVILGSGWTERFRDHYIALPYLLAHCAVNITCIVLAPEIGVPMLMVLFVIFAFVSLRMDLGRMLPATLIIALVVAAVIAMLGDRITLPMQTWQERAITGLWFALTLTRISLLGLYSSHLRKLLAKRNTQLADTFARLDQLATRDELTGAMNRRAVMLTLKEEQQRLLRTGQSFAIAMLDIDNFKQINDAFGHLVGDEVLRWFTRTVDAGLRSTDRLGRYGGEEFLVLFIATADEAVVMSAAERLRCEVAAVDWSALTPGKPVTVSVGVAVCRREDSAEQLLSRADTALYEAKQLGRNCVRFG